MVPFSHRTLGHKLRAIVLAGIAVALLVSFVAIALGEMRKEVNRVHSRASIFAELVIENGSAPMRFEDVLSAERLLGSLRHVEQIRAAVLLRNNGDVFATFPADLPHTAPHFESLIAARESTAGLWNFPRYWRAWPVFHDGEQLGHLVLEVSLASTITELAQWMLLVLAGLFVGGLVSTMLVRRAEQSMVSPILQLANVVRDVRNQGRYDLRAPAGPRDEVGELVDGVNSMLAEIEVRDSALAAHRDRLEVDVANRTEELSLAKEEADAARDEAEAANRAKSVFLANMSHEIRTPLNGVLGMVELMRSTPLDERQQRMVETLQGSAESLLYLINDVLDVSKIEAGKLELEPLDFSPRRAAEDVALLFAERARQKGVELVLVVSAAVPETICADGHRFRQILNNLVSNAVKFTDRGHVRIDLDAHTENDTLRLCARIEDSGIGIDADLRLRLFHAFIQADSSMARRYGGTGLGLSISRQLAVLMGGDITVHSTPGEGACFTAEIAVTTWSAARPVAVVTTSVGVVAHHAALRCALVDQLAALGCAAKAFASGAEAKAALAAGASIDTLFVDEDLGGERGDALIAQLREHPLRCVALTRLRSASDEEDARRSGADTCVSKPALATDLLAALRGDAKRVARWQQSRSPSVRTNARVLLAEDHPVNAEIASAFLGECGCRVTVATNGREAVAAFRRARFDLVLMDIQMPEMDGVEATQALREIERTQDTGRVPIVALTANALRDDRSAALAAGMDDYLTKPVAGERLREALLRWLPDAHKVDIETSVPSPPPPVADATALASDKMAPVLDMEALLSVPGVKGDLNSPMLKRLVSLFLNDTAKQLDGLHEALGVGRVEDAQRHAHKMKSAAAAVGAASLAKEAREFDTRLKCGAADDGLERATRMREAFAGYADALREHGVIADADGHFAHRMKGNDR